MIVNPMAVAVATAAVFILAVLAAVPALSSYLGLPSQPLQTLLELQSHLKLQQEEKAKELTLEEKILKAVKLLDAKRGRMHFRNLTRLRILEAFKYRESPFEIINGVIVGNTIESESLNLTIAQRFVNTVSKNRTFSYRAETEGKKNYRIIMEAWNELEGHLTVANGYTMNDGKNKSIIRFGFIRESEAINISSIGSLCLRVKNLPASLLFTEFEMIVSPLEVSHTKFYYDYGQAIISFRSLDAVKKAAFMLDKLVVRGTMITVRSMKASVISRPSK
ncbi:hypothetical protein PRIPAC_89029 [Pristionchus pacificus]|uniref:Uncharacterized protein n=1 Tax=Pristionchus pacificus TaxID=54126 RepID=A0A2A6B6S7_PRIPA|nr:hypothetical protein PRIPAC_89029 [Pristionchus pacificus]|eukprot:PDM61577.1 hypothetical protein PRIPAC_51019 [Pristionchus pacificus]